MKLIHKLDPDTGAILDRIEVPDPEGHGLTLHDGEIWFCCATTCRVCTIPYRVDPRLSRAIASYCARTLNR